ncbi:MAG TPA: hypothetical protein DEF39_05070 [Hungateiclostridium thermocellum]|jgi:hypothetical protein|uniref:Uncharacterized protein n=2 Tax=Acetivibrio thermocellus TaxID=1515 RepID=A3DBC1_ACET2|nr:hypothetical protein Cthe_0008 [Acetivibrio thermocellus ATCC 27405]ADU75256.1 hypothetical protein Clo1313_2221 [Acetivibrio thermocellus DSM 1313]ALX09242.1 hypothetical protein AD2_02254 [Acetivibrio thermocellus AD2]ANV76994.1 hypothetical protein LQRI_2253 [Acetivibrio thermocellus DSM 2360]EIC04817.1 hypothetical protein YSBL_1544 [Acetivibrio thermocellus YS]CDG34688.1 hypothetical protein CTHBC1_0005 [Acetivibrio thermocellus BC1]SOD23722.1 hypothetical protein SAMN04515622_1284 [A
MKYKREKTFHFRLTKYAKSVLGSELYSNKIFIHKIDKENKVYNQDVVQLMKRLYGIDMEKSQYPKLRCEIPPVDIVITMGCNMKYSGEISGGILLKLESG